MNFLADESVDKPIVEALRGKDYIVGYIAESDSFQLLPLWGFGLESKPDRGQNLKAKQRIRPNAVNLRRTLLTRRHPGPAVRRINSIRGSRFSVWPAV